MSLLLCQGTALALPLKDASVHTCVTSPPYYGLRDYQTGAWQGGAPDCTHSRRTSLKEASITTQSRPTNTNHEQEGWRGGVCGRCGATRVDAQIGLEASVEEYVAAMVQVFREVKRVLRPDGTLWLNMGDSYANSGQTGLNVYSATSTLGPQRNGLIPQNAAWQRSRPRQTLPPGIPAKNLLGMPWRLAFALQADGWILRSDIIWDKPSCMPESVQDRPTRSHEYVFLFSKQARYFYDAEAVREPHSEPWRSQPEAIYQEAHGPKERVGLAQMFAMTSHREYNPNGRNARTVWRIASESTSFAHFATFPQALVRRCLLAGAPTQVCAACGAPWRREVERSLVNTAGWGQATKDHQVGVQAPQSMIRNGQGRAGDTRTTTRDFSPTCVCAAGVAPSVVLDCFAGSGTTLLVARELGHHAIGLDLSYPYLHAIARERLGLADLARWQGARQETPAIDYTALPLFGGL